MIPAFAQLLEERVRAALAALADRIGRLEQRAVVLESGCLVTPYLGTIPASYTSGQPTVVLATGVTLGPLQYLDSYTPAAGDVVLLVPAGQTYIITGKPV